MNYSFDGDSFIIDGKRVWLYVGEIHYYRFPRSEWKRALEIARAAGLNTVSTYVAWNIHEPQPGVWDFEGDKDLAAFLDLAHELGLYVMLRPGPYICGEWTGGGIPAWLLNDKRLEQRTDEPVFMENTERWLRRVMEIAAPRQVTNGGCIISIQNDNEYHGGWDARTTAYIEKVTGILRDAGCDVAVTACNCHAPTGRMAINYDADMYDPRLYERLNMTVTYNTCSSFDVIDELRAYQPGKPSIISELWTGPMVFWQKPVPTGMPDADVARWIMECTLRHAMATMYMFIGGTNFGFNGASNIATSYSSAYPVGDALRPRSKYYALKPFGAFLDCYGSDIAGARGEAIDAANARATRFDMGERGGVIVAAGERASTSLKLGGDKRDIRFTEVHGGALADGLRACGNVIDWADLFVLGESHGALILYGNAGQDFTVSVNGTAHSGIVLAKPQLMDICGMNIIVIDERTARHTWLLSDKVIFGGDFAFDGEEFEPGDWERVFEYDGNALTARSICAAPAPAALPALTRWERRDALEGAEFTPIDAPMFHEKLGALNGYVWYRGHIHSDCARTGALTAACASTRAAVYVNGTFAGELGERRTENERFDYANPADRLRERVTVQLIEGDNEILLLSEDTGRCCLDSMPLGISGDVYVDSRQMSLAGATYIGKSMLSERAADYLYSPALTAAREVDTISWHVQLKRGERILLVVHDAPCFVTMGGEEVEHIHMVKRPWQSFGYKDGGSHMWHCYLPKCCEGDNELTIQCPGSVDHLLSHAQAFIVKDSDRIGDWSWCALNEDVPYEGRADHISAAGRQDKLLVPFAEIRAHGQSYTPAWYTTTFPRPEAARSLFLSMGEMRKGQIYLNGHNIGRFMRCPAQSRYYLPEAWLCDENRLTIFEEYGIEPDGVRLER